jgi:hypothetical protein
MHLIIWKCLHRGTNFSLQMKNILEQKWIWIPSYFFYFRSPSCYDSIYGDYIVNLTFKTQLIPEHKKITRNSNVGIIKNKPTHVLSQPYHPKINNFQDENILKWFYDFFWNNFMICLYYKIVTFTCMVL